MDKYIGKAMLDAFGLLGIKHVDIPLIAQKFMLPSPQQATEEVTNVSTKI